MKYIFFFTTAFFLFLSAAYAQEPGSVGFHIVTCGYPGAPDGEQCTFCALMHTGQQILSFLVYLGIIASVIGSLYGGMLMMVSGGNEQRFSQGKNALTAAVTGLVIVLVAWVAVNTILNFLGNPGAFPLPWNELSC